MSSLKLFLALSNRHAIPLKHLQLLVHLIN